MEEFGRIRNKDRLLDGVQEWHWLSGCFGNDNVVPSDIDGFMERNGYCLFLEHKQPEGNLKAGQEKALERLARKEGCAVIVFWARYRFGQTTPPRVESVRIMNHHRRPVECTTKMFKTLCRSWERDAINGTLDDGIRLTLGERFDIYRTDPPSSSGVRL